MTDNLKRWLRAANPVNAPRGMAEAQRGARLASVGLIISMLGSLPALIIMMLRPEAFTDLTGAEYAAMGMSAQDVALQTAFMEAIWPGMLGIGMATSLIVTGAMAWVQWRQMTRAIPIVLLAWTAYSVLTALVGLILQTPQILPMAYTAVAWGVSAVAAVLYAASFRGATALHRLKQQP